MDLTTVDDTSATFHDGTTVERVVDLEPDTRYEHNGTDFRTLARPYGELHCRLATVNDVHFGEVEAGRLGDLPGGPIKRAPEGAAPYPETMNRAAVVEMAAADLAAVVVKGDLTTDGTPEEFAAFEDCYRTAFGDRLFVVRGNHDAYRGQTDYAGDTWIELPGVAVALLDTAIPTSSSGHLTAEQLDWLDAGAADSTVPVLAMGHHQQWVKGERNPEYFGIDPDASDALTDGDAAAPGDRRLHRRPHPPPPRALGRRRRAVDRGRVRQGLPRDVGRVPRLRRRHPAGRPPGVDTRGAGVERGVPHAVLRLRRRLRRATPSATSTTAASPSTCAERFSIDFGCHG